MIRVTIRNPHETVPLTVEVAQALGTEAARDSSGLLAAIYEVEDEAEIERIRATGLVCERVEKGAPTRLSPNARAYLKAATASERASEARRDLPPGSSRAKVTSANARWISAAEERDRLAALLTPEDRVAVGLP